MQESGLITEHTWAKDETLPDGSDFNTQPNVSTIGDILTTTPKGEKKLSNDLQTVTPILVKEQSRGDLPLNMTDVPQIDKFKARPAPFKATGPVAILLITGNVVFLIPDNLFAVAVLSERN